MLRGEAYLPILHGYWLPWSYWLVAAFKSVETQCGLLKILKDEDGWLEELQKRRGGNLHFKQTVDLTVHSRVSQFINARSSVSIVIVYRKGINMLTQVTGSPPCQQTRFLLTQTCDCLVYFVLGLDIEYRPPNYRQRSIASPRSWYIDCTALKFIQSSGMQWTCCTEKLFKDGRTIFVWTVLSNSSSTYWGVARARGRQPRCLERYGMGGTRRWWRVASGANRRVTLEGGKLMEEAPAVNYASVGVCLAGTCQHLHKVTSSSSRRHNGSFSSLRWAIDSSLFYSFSATYYWTWIF